MRVRFLSLWWCRLAHKKWRRRTTVLSLTHRDYRSGRVVVADWAVRCADCALQDMDTTFTYIPRDSKPPGVS